MSAKKKEVYEKHCNDSLDVSCLMLATMSSDLQKQYEHTDAHTMIEGLRGMFQNQARTERFNISKSLFACKLPEGSPRWTPPKGKGKEKIPSDFHFRV
ncbi:hypothetical protein ACP4OV_018238 [Aristida adscensionis]